MLTQIPYLPVQHGGAEDTVQPMKTLRYFRDAIVFAPCYIALDWASYVYPLGPFNITPWNPQPALAIVWMLLGGVRYVPAVRGDDLRRRCRDPSCSGRL